MSKNIIIISVVVVLVVVGGLIFFANQNSTSGSLGEQKKVENLEITEQLVEEPKDMPEKSDTVVDIAVANENFSTLVTALTEAELVEILAGEGPFTVFAPTNDAFKALGDETFQAVLADKENLTNILTYHVVPGKVMASEVVNLPEAVTVNGRVLTFNVEDDGSVTVNGAKIVTTDIEASNGVIHVIDTVLIPE
jgi:uncharacterized surface protein with fasciclin (FAS1) repeats